MNLLLCEILFACVVSAEPMPLDEITFRAPLFDCCQDDARRAQVDVLFAASTDRTGGSPPRFDLTRGSPAFDQGMYRYAKSTFDAIPEPAVSPAARFRLAFRISYSGLQRQDWGALNATLETLAAAETALEVEPRPENTSLRSELPLARAGKPTREEVMSAWAPIHGLLPTPEDNQAVARRMADLALELAVDREVDATPAGEAQAQAYGPAVKRYRELLDSGLARDRDRILYQLARALELAGDVEGSMATLDRLLDEHPKSPWSMEARFRRAEAHFSGGRYARAAKDFAAVVAAGDQGSLYPNALYMLGWSKFRENRLDEGLDHFFALIGRLRRDGEELTQAETELLDDTLRVVVLALEYLDGVATLAEWMERLESPAWQHEVYARLAADDVEKERFLVGVKTWSLFVERNPLDARAPIATREMIRILEAGGFAGEILPRKQDFVMRSGARSGFPAMHDATADCPQAARWQEESLQTFPEDPATPYNLLLPGHICTDPGDHARAAAACRKVMRDHIRIAGGVPERRETGHGRGTCVGSLVEARMDTGVRELIAAQVDLAETRQCLLASVYRQGEQSEAAGDAAGAAAQHLRLREIDANSEGAIRGQFEAVATYDVPARQSAATFQIADLCSAFGKTVMAEARPSGLSPWELEHHQILPEEEGYPFEERAIALHQTNMQRSWQGHYDDGVKRSFTELKHLLPARFDKQEIEIAHVENIH